MEIPIKIKNLGGSADRHLMRAADQAEMIAGLQRAISYIILSLTEERLVERVTKKSQVQILSKAPERGSIIHEMIAEIAAHPNVYAAGAFTGIATSVVGNYITRFIDFVIKQSAGLLTDEQYEDSARKFQRQEPYFESLVEKVEPHIASVHAPINEEETIVLTIGDTNQIHFDIDTKEYTSASNWSEETVLLTGFVSRLNLLTGNGRIYTNEHRKVLSFSQVDAFRHTELSELLSWSLRQKDTNLPSEVEILARAVTSNTGRIKRLWIEGAKSIT
ncbi:MAG: hypothetical protein HQL43_09205 [Alphaproteobacteria bacterium]|nr:hypothetical protein [Alphaproteobacteria bacterium]